MTAPGAGDAGDAGVVADGAGRDGAGRDGAGRDAICDVLVRYATGIDRRDWDLFRSCFTDDCHIEYEGIGTWDSADAVTAFMTEVHAPVGHTLHRMTNFAVDVEGDGTRGRARSYVDAILMAPDGHDGINATGFYDDELVRTEGAWRIATRRFTMVQSRAVGG